MLCSKPACHLTGWSPTFLAPGTGFREDSFPTEGGGGGDASGGTAGDGEQWRPVGEALLARPPLTSSWADWYWSAAPGLGTPDLIH